MYATFSVTLSFVKVLTYIAAPLSPPRNALYSSPNISVLARCVGAQHLSSLVSGSANGVSGSFFNPFDKG